MQHYRLTIAFLLVTFMTGVVSTPATPDPRLRPLEPAATYPVQTTYPLVCRGGRGLSLIRGGPVPDAAGVEMVVMSLTFNRGNRAPGPHVRNLGPGQCSWLDRPVNAQESTELRFKVPLHAAGNPNSDVNSSDAVKFPDAYSIPNYMASPNHYYTFSAYSATDGFLRATTSRPGRP